MTPARAALLLALVTLAGVAPAARAESVLQYALALPYSPMPADLRRRERVDAARQELAAAGPTPPDCAASLGAARRAALLASLSAALSQVGAHEEALGAAIEAADCAPRDSPLQARLARAALDATRPQVAANAIAVGLQLDPGNEDLQGLAIELDYLRGRWREVQRRQHALAPARGGSMHTSLALLALAARRHAAQEQDRLALAEPAPQQPDARDAWPDPLWQHIVGTGSEARIVAAIIAEESAFQRPRMLCEALFHLGELARLDGETPLAQRHFAAALRTKALGEPAYRLAQTRLRQLREASQAAPAE